MPKLKLTKTVVAAAQPESDPYELRDTMIPGFLLKVTPTGRKVYILQYRIGGRGTPTKRVTLGAHGALTPEQAREAAVRMAGAIAAGGFGRGRQPRVQ